MYSHLLEVANSITFWYIILYTNLIFDVPRVEHSGNLDLNLLAYTVGVWVHVPETRSRWTNYVCVYWSERIATTELTKRGTLRERLSTMCTHTHVLVHFWFSSHFLNVVLWLPRVRYIPNTILLFLSLTRKKNSCGRITQLRFINELYRGRGEYLFSSKEGRAIFATNFYDKK